jgi:hypothetical protein
MNRGELGLWKRSLRPGGRALLPDARSKSNFLAQNRRRIETLASHAAKAPDAPPRVSTSGGNRTPNRRFWRPVLYQLSYARISGSTIPSVQLLLLSRLFMRRVLALASTILLELEAVRSPGLFLNPIVAFSAARAFEPYIFPHQLAPALHPKSESCKTP